MIKKISSLVASKIVNEDTIVRMSKMVSMKKNREIHLTKEEAEEIITFSLQRFFGDFLMAATILVLASILNVIRPTIMIIVTFYILRRFMGEKHLSTYLRCFIFTITSFLTGGLIIKYVSEYVSGLGILAIVFLMVAWGGYTVWKYVPTNMEGIKNKKEIDKHKKIGHICISAAGYIMFSFYTDTIVVLSLAYGLFLELFTISPIGIKFFKFIDNLFQDKQTVSKCSSNQ